MKPITVQDLVDQVRAQLDEINTTGVDTVRDILPALNRAQDKASDILAKCYPDPLLAMATFTLGTSATNDYPIPEDALSDRVMHLVVNIGSSIPVEVKKLSFYQAWQYQTQAKASIPYGYFITGRMIKFVPEASSNYTFSIYYVRQPQPFVLPYGRVTNIGSNTLVLDSATDEVGHSPSSNIGDYSCFVNIIDPNTGGIRLTNQVKSTDLVTNPAAPIITFKTTGDTLDRSIVWGNTPVLATALSSQGVLLDDYVCPVGGTCVPELRVPTTNFYVQYAVAELRRKLGDEQAMNEFNILQQLQKDVTEMWTAREQDMRVIRRSPFLSAPTQRYVTSEK